MIIRDAKMGDLKACYNIGKTRELLTAEKEPIPISYLKDLIKEKKTVFLVAEEEKIIGYSIADILPGKLAIWWLIGVDPKYQNKGVGKELAKAIERECKKRGSKYIVGYAPKFNKKTLSFHKKLGFISGEEMIEILKKIK